MDFILYNIGSIPHAKIHQGVVNIQVMDEEYNKTLVDRDVAPTPICLHLVVKPGTATSFV